MTDEELQAIKDELEIRNLVGKLATMADHAEDLDPYFELWTEDATFDMTTPIGAQADDPDRTWKVSSKSALRENRRNLRQSGFQGPGTNTWHVNTTLHIDLIDETNAEARSYWIFIHSKDDIAVRGIGHYHDTFRKEDGRWKLAYRKVTPGRGGQLASADDIK